MPLYEYHCSDCKTHFELLVNHRNADVVVCMNCHSENVRRLLSVFAAHRSGGGADHTFADTSSVDGGGGCCGGGSCGCH